ncbi:prolipoprotein diacylglyceryl transferase [Emticicia sp. CRIBPO]|nr:prolipoprotein diacylglyceryl transferase [Emticicia sp. CRIBPO]NBA87108.1 prolipoprotein diacylglyceryl transferase [Emticicia sp. CRIBPO]
MFSQVVWDVSPVIFKIGDFEVRWYGLLFAAGFLIGYQIIARVFKIENKPEKDLDSLLLTMIVSIVLGARIGHYVFYEGNHFFDNPGAFLWDMLIPPYAGLASHGAAMGTLLGLFIYTRRNKTYDYLWLTDRMVLTAALGGAFIRFGNLINSEIVGKASDVPWAFIFKQNFEFAQVPRHPAQLYESISCLILFALLYFLYDKWRAKTPRGSLTAIFFIWIFGLRFFYEFLKENQEQFEDSLPLNMGQILSIPIVIFGVIVLVRSLRKKENSL